MPTRPNSLRYTNTAIALHWLVAILIVWGFALGWIMTDIPGITPSKLKYFSWHKWIGVTVFVLAMVRLAWRFTHAAPAMSQAMHASEKLAAHAAHFLLYCLMLAIPVSGYFYTAAAGIPVVYLGILPLPTLIAPDQAVAAVLKTVHIWMNYGLLLIVGAHLLGVVKHELLDRQPLLARMLPGRKSSS
ncbi:prokaryotic cytochrome b561 family protein [Collimonas fungivorans]|uniref:Prokaryotic cytochrome b561 family protein n=1 Tax=Collimonas fungivorans TaxID=158899 RepID=A0A127PH58_9BURK|nr:cytochrome b [Collimonas fungivorans]AMO97128.1 prokaryotic cytochrome b561 family protein [Collimonas fungivorans]